jgi:4-diphosphocytidyl-2C-methyl-D-erythritol kinase
VVTPVEGWGGWLRVLLVKLPFGVPTPWAYREWRESREVPGLPYGEQVLGGGEVLVNDLERPVFAKYPVLGLLKRRLLGMEGVSGALMSGSGSTVFAVLEEGAAHGLKSATVYAANIGEGHDPEIVARGHDIATVHRVEHLLYLAEYKRRQSAPGVKITKKNFGRDRRYPITNRFRDR